MEAGWYAVVVCSKPIGGACELLTVLRSPATPSLGGFGRCVLTALGCSLPAVYIGLSRLHPVGGAPWGSSGTPTQLDVHQGFRDTAMHTHTPAYTHPHLHTLTHIYIHLHTCKYMHPQIYNTLIHTLAHIYIHIHISTYSHTYMHYRLQHKYIPTYTYTPTHL